MDKDRDERRAFLARSGTVNVLDMIGTLSAVATEVTFHELSRETGEPLEAGCSATATSVTLSAELDN